MQDGSDDIMQTEGVTSSGVVNINTTSAILFVVIASCFLVMLYKLMSLWFMDVLVVLFCIGGIEVCLPLLPQKYSHLACGNSECWVPTPCFPCMPFDVLYSTYVGSDK